MSRPSPIRFDDSLDPFAKETQYDLPAYDPQGDVETAEYSAVSITELELRACKAVDATEVIVDGISPFTLTKIAIQAIAYVARLTRR
jgi:hypothetical protein